MLSLPHLKYYDVIRNSSWKGGGDWQLKNKTIFYVLLVVFYYTLILKKVIVMKLLVCKILLKLKIQWKNIDYVLDKFDDMFN